MASHKPLPEIPAASTSPASALSKEFRDHRSRLLRHLLVEVEQVAERRDRWIYVLEDVLDQLSRRLGEESWLKSIRRGRKTLGVSKEQITPVEVTTEDEQVFEGTPRRLAGETKPEEEVAQDEHAVAEAEKPENLQPLEQIRKLASKPAGPYSPSHSSHLLICIAPHSGIGPLPPEDSGFDLIPANLGCTFTSGTFLLDDEGSDIAFGKENWKGADCLIGGTFTFKGLTSPRQHNTLARMLRLAIYIQLSMTLEQHFLKDSHIQLTPHGPKPCQLSLSTPTGKQTDHEQSPSKGKGPLRFLSIFTRKSLPFSRPKSPEKPRGHSVDLSGIAQAPLSWAETGFRLRRFSFIGEKAPHIEKSFEATIGSALRVVQDSQAYLSTSVGVSFEAPLLLVHLAEQEEVHPKRRLKGDEKVGLRSILGWDGRESQGKGMSGIAGFVRQQGLSVLVSRRVPSTPPTEASGSEISTDTSRLSNLPQNLTLCGKPQWVAYCYFSHDSSNDKPLGEALNGFINDRTLPCEQPGCHYPRGQHLMYFIHGGVRITVKIEDSAGDAPSEGAIQSWESCTLCGSQTTPVELCDGSWLFSFAKFLELLVYSPTLLNINPPICEHSGTKFHLVRHFSTGQGLVSFSTSPIEDIFELRVPRIQIRSVADKSPGAATGSSEESEDVHGYNGDGDKKVLRREIRQWWASVSNYVDKLEEVVIGDEPPPKAGKALPRLPSNDDDYELFENNPTPSVFSNASSSTTPSQPLSSQSMPAESRKDSYVESRQPSSIPEDLESPFPTPAPPTVPPKDNLLERLSNLRHGLHRLEQNLYIQLAQAPPSSLNDVRRSFLAAAQGTRKRLLAWKKKHLSSNLVSLAGELTATEPQWWSAGCHAVPGTNIIIREHDWGSIIAFTLGSKDYHDELANLTFRRGPPPSTGTPASTAPPSSFFSVAGGYRFFTPQSSNQPDPDQDDAVWHDVEPYSAVITRKEHTRDPTSLLSIRSVLRKNTIPTEQLGLDTQHQGSGAMTPSRAKPNVGVSMQEAGGQVLSEDNIESVEKLLHELEQSPAGSSTPSEHHPFTLSDDSSTVSTGQINAHVRRQNNSSVLSLSAGSDTTIGKTAFTITPEPSSTGEGSGVPPVPPKDPPKVPPKGTEGDATLRGSPDTTASSFATTIASSLLRLMMNTPEVRSASPSPRHHGLLHTDIEAIDERPHIKYDWTIGKRLKFSCTVFYAKQFDSLRKSCGIDDSFVKSLSKSNNWAAEGGKSKSNFWKTNDDRFIIKSLVNAWNVADLQFLIDLAPAYFRYMESTASKATVLAKLFGFYTIEIRNLETGAIQSKVDLLVTENLFYDQKISKTFDLKGIQGRKVKAKNTSEGTTKTLFDNEWIEGQQKTLMLVRPHSKRILREAIKSDAEFLARNNIMDYSLLLGVDESKKEIACGLVDTIGSYTFAKTLEYKAKQGLQSGKEVTVVPPADYQERLVKALEGYFVACPDKWSKPLDESRMISDPDHLPSVL